eukprot:CAMPEP_0204648360 /NCGR_PEP_ID=MMETSP0718-20130828/7619_1 /ASSEMBLY_ACC=CAM_ASM_000674 /TAXON_ID=230516 /ORGANISM="Chaetoceros curvisetus" /LENGTH=42 /DNA_ID= /DNA_START= /DNA_END= /DNA_ORIENTATION=
MTNTVFGDFLEFWNKSYVVNPLENEKHDYYQYFFGWKRAKNN